MGGPAEVVLGRHEGETLHVIALVADICDSTKKVDGLMGRQVGDFYTIFPEVVAEVIASYGGYVTAVADAVIGVFFPAQSALAVHDAVMDCACGIVKVTREAIGPEYVRRGLPDIGCRVGLSEGDARVVVSRPLPESLPQLQLYGSAVNHAFKISKTGQCEVVRLDESVYSFSHAWYKARCKEVMNDPAITAMGIGRIYEVRL